MIRDGTVVSTLVSEEVTKSDLVEQIIGHPLSMTSGKASGKRKILTEHETLANCGDSDSDR